MVLVGWLAGVSQVGIGFGRRAHSYGLWIIVVLREE